MISYAPLMRTLERKHKTLSSLYTQDKILGNGTVVRIKRGESISTNTIDAICRVLRCRVGAVIEYVPDAQTATDSADASDPG